MFIVMEGEIEVTQTDKRQSIQAMGIFANIYDQGHENVTATKSNT